MNNDQLVVTVQHLHVQVLASAVPGLRPFGLDEANVIRSEFVGWLRRRRVDYPSWQHAFNAWVGATEQHWGRVRVQRAVCPDCHGRRFNRRTLRACLGCLNGKPWIDVAAYASTELVPAAAVVNTIPAVGDRVRVTGNLPDDPCPVEVGALGTVTGVNRLSMSGPHAQISVDWDNRRTLMLLSTDPFEIVPALPPGESS